MTVILCVIPATVDFSTAAAIKLAKKHDPAGERTMVGGRELGGCKAPASSSSGGWALCSQHAAPVCAASLLTHPHARTHTDARFPLAVRGDQD